MLINVKIPITLTKSQLIKSISTDTGLSSINAEKFLLVLYNIIKETLSNGESISIRGFGKFYVKHQKKRKLRHPSTGQIIIIGPKKVVKFRCSKSLNKEISDFDEFKRQNEIILRQLYQLIENSNDDEDEEEEEETQEADIL